MPPRPRIKLEASGGVNLDRVKALADTGVDRISVGALTHSAPALDLALDLRARLAPRPERIPAMPGPARADRGLSRRGAELEHSAS